MPSATVELLKRLNAKGFSNEHFRRLHHFGKRASKKAHQRYCEATESFRPESRNNIVRERLQFIEGCLPRVPSEKDWDRTIREAVIQFPFRG